VAWRIIGVNDSFAFAYWNQSLIDESQDIIDIIPRTALLPIGHCVDEMEAIRVPEDRQYRFAVIDPSSRPCSRLTIFCKPVPLPVDFSIKP
jgi:hypothetical protein